MSLKKLEGWLQAMKETTVTVQVPRFRIEDNFSLKEQLSNMGLKDLFSPENASLPGMKIERFAIALTLKLSNG